METGQDHLTCDGFSAWIIVSSTKTPQYGMERKEGENQISCWISSETDREFSIGFCRNQNEEYSYTAKIKLDGHIVADNLLQNFGRYPLATRPQVKSTMRISATEVRKFVFGSLELTDDDVYAEDPSQNIGEISLIIQRVNNLVPVAQPVHVYQVPATGKVHERSKKGFAHQVKFGSAKEQPLNPVSQMYSYQPHGKPITFIFKYRPLAMLQATGIVPRIPPASEQEPLRSTSHTARTGKRKVFAVKTEEAEEETTDKEDLARERELLDELERINSRKRSKKEGNARFMKKIKTEPRNYFTPREVIDLT